MNNGILQNTFLNVGGKIAPKVPQKVRFRNSTRKIATLQVVDILEINSVKNFRMISKGMFQ